jgi:hypothetical protein
MQIVRAVGVLVPERRRDEWMLEWQGELWYRASLLDGSRSGDGHAARRLVVRTLGSFPHALWMLTDEMRLDPMLQDLKYAIRGIVKRPAFAALVIATLALGIGANTAMFSIVHSVLLRPLPYERPDELVYMYGAFSQGNQASVSPPDYLDYRDQNSVFRRWPGGRSSAMRSSPFGRAGTRAVLDRHRELLLDVRHQAIPRPRLSPRGRAG